MCRMYVHFKPPEPLFCLKNLQMHADHNVKTCRVNVSGTSGFFSWSYWGSRAKGTYLISNPYLTIAPTPNLNNVSHTCIYFIETTNRERFQSRGYKATFTWRSQKVTRKELIVFLFIDPCGGLLSALFFFSSDKGMGMNCTVIKLIMLFDIKRRNISVLFPHFNRGRHKLCCIKKDSQHGFWTKTPLKQVVWP